MRHIFSKKDQKRIIVKLDELFETEINGDVWSLGLKCCGLKHAGNLIASKSKFNSLRNAIQRSPHPVSQALV
jgi:hypothetical protein